MARKLARFVNMLKGHEKINKQTIAGLFIGGKEDMALENVICRPLFSIHFLDI